MAIQLAQLTQPKARVNVPVEDKNGMCLATYSKL